MHVRSGVVSTGDFEAKTTTLHTRTWEWEGHDPASPARWAKTKDLFLRKPRFSDANTSFHRQRRAAALMAREAEAALGDLLIAAQGVFQVQLKPRERRWSEVQG